MLLINNTFTRIAKAKIFTKINIRQAFYKICINLEYKDLIAFRTRIKAYKYKVMPFKFTNGPAIFQQYINNALIGYLDDFCSAYIDNILIFS